MIRIGHIRNNDNVLASFQFHDNWFEPYHHITVRFSATRERQEALSSVVPGRVYTLIPWRGKARYALPDPAFDQGIRGLRVRVAIWNTSDPALLP